MDPWVTQAFSYTPEMELSFDYSPFSRCVGVPILTFWVNPVSQKTKNKMKRGAQFSAQVAIFWILIWSWQNPIFCCGSQLTRWRIQPWKKRPEVAPTSFKWLIPSDQKQLQLRYQNYNRKMNLQRKAHRCNDHSFNTNRCILCHWSVSKSPNIKSSVYVDESICLTLMDSDHS